MFARFFTDEILDLVEIFDPYIKTRHQVILFNYRFKCIVINL
jgi:hypothetical protein